MFIIVSSNHSPQKSDVECGVSFLFSSARFSCWKVDEDVSCCFSLCLYILSSSHQNIIYFHHLIKISEFFQLYFVYRVVTSYSSQSANNDNPDSQSCRELYLRKWFLFFFMFLIQVLVLPTFCRQRIKHGCKSTEVSVKSWYANLCRTAQNRSCQKKKQYKRVALSDKRR